MWPDLPVGLATFIPRERRVFPTLDFQLPADSRRCWNCRTLLRVDEPCGVCSAPFKPLEVAQRAPAPEPWFERYPVLPGLNERLARISKVDWRARFRSLLLKPTGEVEPHVVQLAAALIVGLLFTMAWTTNRVERNVPLGALDTVSVAHAKQLRLAPRPTAALPRVANLGTVPVAIQESWIAPVGRREYEGLTSDRIRVYPTRRYRQYIRLAAADPTLVERVTQESGTARLPLEELGDGLYAIDVRDAFPRPTYYRVEGGGTSARIRIH